MKILVTGAKGFVGKNLIAELNNRGYRDIYQFDRETDVNLLDEYCKNCDFVFHLAGANRPKNEGEFQETNRGFTEMLVEALQQCENHCPITFASSTQAILDNSYGESKLAGEKVLRTHADETGCDVIIYRFSNIFGKWNRPNYNGVVATFCYNISRGIPIRVEDESKVLDLLYIDDVVEELINAMEGHGHRTNDGFGYVPISHRITLGEVVTLLYSFKEGRATLGIPCMTEGSFEKKLYSTYLSYLPTDSFSYPLTMHEDLRGSFTEIFRTQDRGQFSVNVSRVGITKGNHWHHTKVEKYLVVHGKALIQLRRIDSDEIIEYHLCGEKMEVLDIPPGYVHRVINEGTQDLVTFMWSNECFDKDKPDTYYQVV